MRGLLAHHPAVELIIRRDNSYQMSASQREAAKGFVDKIFQTGRIKGEYVDISRGHRINWGPPLNSSWFGIPEGNKKYVVEPATIKITDFLGVQASSRPSLTYSGFISGAYGPTVAEAKETIELGNGQIPTPVLEIKSGGKVMQEGRSRAVGAMRGGAEYMPIWIAKQVYR